MKPPESRQTDAIGFGPLLARLRREAGFSQLDLALEAEMSARHLGFLEVDRAQPSRVMIARLADALRLRPAARDRLFLAAGLLPADAARSPARYRRGALAVSAMETVMAIHESREATPTAAVAGFLSEVGIVHFATATLWRDQNGLHLVADAGGQPPDAWLDHYAQCDFAKDDPVVRWNLVGSGLLHSDRLAPAAMGTRPARMMDAAAEHGLRACVALPLHGPDGRVRSFCGWTDGLDADDAEALNAVRFVATAWLDHVAAAGDSTRLS